MRTITSLGSFAVKNDGSEDFKTYVLEPLNEIDKELGWFTFKGFDKFYYGINKDGDTFFLCDNDTPTVPILTVSQVKEFLSGEETTEQKLWDEVEQEITMEAFCPVFNAPSLVDRLKSKYSITRKPPKS